MPARFDSRPEDRLAHKLPDRLRNCVKALVGMAAGGCVAATASAGLRDLTLVGSGLNSPVYATQAPGYEDYLFVVEQRGTIRLLNLNTRTVVNAPFLDIQGLVDDADNEQGLLGLAFAPDFATSGHFYVNYTHDPTPGAPGLDRTRVDRYTVVNPGTDLVTSVGTRQPVLSFDQDFSNHNGGWLGVSPNDGHLYIATGDGGSGNDPNNRAQTLSTRLGKMLRIDPTGDDFPADANENYAVPADNPFVGIAGAGTLPEIWSYGLRNPWRNSFDRDTGDLWIGDVGQGAREEISFQSGDSAGGENYGWRLREGDIATPGVGGPEPAGHVPPVYDYFSNGQSLFGGNSVVGGYVYRGPDPDLQGTYFFADSFPRQLWTFDPDDPDGTVANIETTVNANGAGLNTPVSFGEDLIGNLYIVDRAGRIFRIGADLITTVGDYNGNGLVEQGDLDLVLQNWGRDTADLGVPGGWINDFPQGLVDQAELDGVLLNWGDTAVPGFDGVVVPEPASLLLAGGGVALSLTRRRG